MGSTRFPGKILHPFCGNQTLIDVLLNNLHKIKGVKIIVATSTNKENDELESYLRDRGEIVFRGSENDVLDRFIKAAEFYNLDGIIRICSDNPFIDWKSVEFLLDQSNSYNGDYMGFRINGKPSILTHFGFWGEFVTLDALKRVYNETPKNSPAHEHVTYHVYTHFDSYQCDWIDIYPEISRREDIRLTVDTPIDMENASQIYKALDCSNNYVSIDEVINYLDEHDDIKKSMLINIQQNKK